MASVPLQRSKRWLEEKGWHVWIVEHFNQWAHIRQDMFGFADLVAIRRDQKGVWAINACADNGEVNAHVKKYIDGSYNDKKQEHIPPNPHLPVWLSCNNRFSVFGWGKRGDRNQRKTWTLRIVEFYLLDAEVHWREVPEDEG